MPQKDQRRDPEKGKLGSLMKERGGAVPPVPTPM